MDIHIGKIIRQRLRLQGRTVMWFAAQLNCNRSNVYKIFNKANIDVELLKRISLILGYNFFRYLSDDIDGELS